MARLPILTAFPLLAFVGLTLAFAAGRNGDGTLPAGYLDRPLPEFGQPAMPGTDAGFSSADLKGQVTLLNVFASWCASCRREHPFLMQLSGTAGVPIYGLNWKDAPGAGTLFLTKHGNPYRATASDAAGTLGARLNVTGVPETYVIDRQGLLRYRHLGPLDEVTWNEVLLPMINRLKEPS